MTARDLVQLTFFALVLRPFLALFIGLRVRGREHLPGTPPFIMVANHSSHLDTVSLLGLFPLQQLPHLRPVAAADYFERNAFVSAFSKTVFNILPITRKKLTTNTNPLPRMEAALRAGQSLILFPEGTRGSGEDLTRFHSGAAHLIEKCPRGAGGAGLSCEHGAQPAQGRMDSGPVFLRSAHRIAAKIPRQLPRNHRRPGNGCPPIARPGNDGHIRWSWNLTRFVPFRRPALQPALIRCYLSMKGRVYLLN